MSFDFIPQIFYDLLCRIIPGMITLMGIYFTLAGPSSALRDIYDKNYNFFSLGTIFLAIIVSYVSGFVLQQVWDIVSKITKKDEDAKNDEKSNFVDKAKNEHEKLHNFYKYFQKQCKGEEDKDMDEDKYPNTYVFHDHLRLTLPTEANRILKLRAEKRMIQTLIVGCIMILFINLFYNPLSAHFKTVKM